MPSVDFNLEPLIDKIIATRSPTVEYEKTAGQEAAALVSKVVEEYLGAYYKPAQKSVYAGRMLRVYRRYMELQTKLESAVSETGPLKNMVLSPGLEKILGELEYHLSSFDKKVFQDLENLFQKLNHRYKKVSQTDAEYKVVIDDIAKKAEQLNFGGLENFSNRFANFIKSNQSVLSQEAGLDFSQLSQLSQELSAARREWFHFNDAQSEFTKLQQESALATGIKQEKESHYNKLFNNFVNNLEEQRKLAESQPIFQKWAEFFSLI